MQARNNPELTREEAVWALAALCRIEHIAFDAGLFLERHPPRANGRYAFADVLLAAQDLGLQTQSVPIKREAELAAAALPAFVFVGSPAPLEAGGAAPRPATPGCPMATHGHRGQHDHVSELRK